MQWRRIFLKMSGIDQSLSHKISNATVFAAMMVVAIHTAGVMGRPLDSVNMESALWWFEAFGHWGVFSVAVPFFFVCSGFFLGRHIGEDGWWIHECRKRIKSLIVPFLTWSLIFAFLPFVMVFFLNLTHGRIVSPTLDTGLLFWFRTLGLSPYAYPGFAQLWYLRTLFLFVLVSPILLWIINGNVRGRGLLFLYVMALVVGANMFSPSRAVKFFYYCFQVEGLFYFCVGLWLGMKERKGAPFYNCDSKFFKWALLILGLLLVLISTLVLRWTGQNYYFFARVVFTPLLLLAFWNFVPSYLMPSWITGGTFAIYVMHGLVLKVMEIIYPQSVVTISQWLVKWAVAFVVPILAAMCLRRFTPGVSLVLLGGR